MGKQVSYDGKVVIVTGGGGGLGRAYSLFFASRGASVIINDLSPSRENPDKKAADVVVEEVKKAGKGDAVANYDSVTDGSKIVQQALDKWGRVDVVINNAGIIRDKSFKSMTDKEWDAVQAVHIKGAFSVTHAAWPIMRKQKYGRIINTASAAGLYGNFGQANYSSAKLSLVAFTKTLAREGAKYNILVNVLAPVAASQMTETIMPPEMLKNMKPEFIVPLVSYLASDANTDVSGQVFEAGAGFYAKLRYQRSKGAVFRTDDSFTPSAVRARFDEVLDYSNPEYPESMTDANYMDFLERSREVPTNKQGDVKVRYDGQTVIVTGAGGGLGRAYALMYGRLGANVVVNDFNAKAAEAVVEEIKKAGGKAVANTSSVEDGDAVVKTALDAFGSLHVIVNNAGILADKSFAGMSEKEWDRVLAIHVRGTYKVCKAAWPIFQDQKYGRILNTASAVGIYGNFGQANYSTAKAAILGLTKTLAIEGKKRNILANTIAPNAGTNMTRTIMPEEMVQAFKPDYVAPVIGFLTSKENEKITQGLFEVSAGWVASVRWERTGGHAFSNTRPPTPEDIIVNWDKITNFDDGRATHPTSTQESLEQIIANFGNEGADEGSSQYDDPEDPEIVKKAKAEEVEASEFSYGERDAILYNLGIGATEKQVQYTFEGSDDFQVLPTFGVIPQFSSSSGVPLDWLPNFSPMMLLHGEQYLSIKVPKIPTSATLVNKPAILEVLDKGKAAAVTTIVQTVDKASGELVFENQSTVFIRGSGGFGGKKSGKDRGPASALNKPPSRKPDQVVEEKTLERQAALYRLSGDYNPLHIDPNFAAVGGFDKPILHGLCSFGISGKHVYEAFGPYQDIKVRFTGHVFPGETLVTEMWKEGDKVIFQTKVKERNTIALAAAAATLAK